MASGEPCVPPDEQEALYNAIATELISLTPDSWRSILLVVTVHDLSNDMTEMEHRIESLDGQEETIIPSGELFAVTHELLSLFREHGQVWRKFRAEVRQSPEGKWRFSINYEYR
jgi:hypothetical protein